MTQRMGRGGGRGLRREGICVYKWLIHEVGGGSGGRGSVYKWLIHDIAWQK